MNAAYYVAGIPYSAELYHHGIKGQRWGIRRYTNPDGTLTDAGLRRYGTMENYRRATAYEQKREQGREAQRHKASIQRGRELYNSGYSHGKNILKTFGKTAVSTAVYGVGAASARALGMKKLSIAFGVAATASAAQKIGTAARKAKDYETAMAYGTTYKKDKKRR